MYSLKKKSFCLIAAAELETIKALFNEKEKELSVAVNKVEELTRQLDELRNGKRKPLGNSNLANMANEKNENIAISELEKLKQELDVSTL